MHPSDKRRLNDGAEAAGLKMPDTKEGLKTYLDNLYDGIVAMQSLDDLGSPAANQQAWDDMLELQRRYDLAKTKLKKLG